MKDITILVEIHLINSAVNERNSKELDAIVKPILAVWSLLIYCLAKEKGQSVFLREW